MWGDRIMWSARSWLVVVIAVALFAAACASGDGDSVSSPDGTPHDATEVGFRAAGEYWSEYLLGDGTVARLKLVVTGVLRLDGMRDQKGQPVYIIESTNVVSISATEDEGN